MSKKWHKGPPPSIGWWPASAIRDSKSLRWWDGQCWSWAATEVFSSEDALWSASRISSLDDIKWQHRPASWPERSRT